MRESRFEQMQREGVMRLPLPRIEQGHYLIEHLMEVGPTTSTGMGPTPITWSEMQAWQQQRGIELQPWEASLLRGLSRDYASEMARAASIDCPAPWVSPEDVNREHVSQRVSALFGRLARKGAKQ